MAGPGIGSTAYTVRGAASSDPTNNWGNDSTGDNHYNPVGVGHGLGTNEASGGILYQDNTYRATNPYIDPNAYNFGGYQQGAQDWIAANQAASAQAQGRQGVSMTDNPYGAQYSVDRGLQGQALQNYQGVISGTAPSVAQNQLYAGMQANNAAAASVAASARGGGANLAAAQRQAMEQQGQNAAGMNNQAALLRANEVQGAMGGYAQAANQRMGMSANMAQQQAQFMAQQRNQNDQMAQFYGQQNYNVANAQLQAQQQRYAQQSNNSLDVQKMNMAANEGNAERGSKTSAGMVGGVTSAMGGAMAAFSDMRLKENIQPADSRWEHAEQRLVPPHEVYNSPAPKAQATVGETFANMKPYSYEYADERLGAGRHAGIMAQDMERTPLGAAAVMDTPQGKAIDLKRAVGLNLAGTADHEQRLRSLEARDMSKPESKNVTTAADAQSLYKIADERVRDLKQQIGDWEMRTKVEGGEAMVPKSLSDEYYKWLNVRQAQDLRTEAAKTAAADQAYEAKGGDYKR